MISLALYLPLVISLDTYTFDCKNLSAELAGSYLGEVIEEKRDFGDRECFALKEKELNLNYRINKSSWRNM